MLFDLDAWLLGTCPNPGALLEGVQWIFWDLVVAAGAGGERDPGNRRVYQLLGSMVKPWTLYCTTNDLILRICVSET